MKILALLVMVLLCAYGQCWSLGSDKCTWGPSYWCSHIKHAKECHAVGHCKETIWKTQKVSIKKDPSCTFCQLMIDNIRHIMKFTTKKTEQYNMLAKSCTVFPTALKQKCKDLVKNYLQEVMYLVSSDLDIKTVCVAIGLCERMEEAVESSPVTEHLVKNGSTDCADCKTFFKDVERRLSDNKTIAHLEEVADALVCSQLGPFGDICKKVLHRYIVEIIKYLNDQLDPDTLCHMINFCENDTEFSEKWLLTALSILKKVKYNSEIDCILCQSAVSDFRNVIREKSFQQAVINFLRTDVCTLLGNFQAECKTYVDAYDQSMFEFLANELDPKAVCNFFGFCNQPSQITEIHLHRASLKSSLTHINTIQEIVKPAEKKASANPACVLCEFIMKEIDTMIGSNRSEAAVEKALDEVCNILPDTITQECKDFVSAYGAAIIQLLVQELDPLKVCTALKLCTSSVVSAIKLVKSNDAVCDICTEMMDVFLGYIKQNATIQQVKALLEDICKQLPDEIAKECDAFVTKYVQLVMDLIAQEYSAKQICQAIGLCQQKINNTLYFLKAFRRGPMWMKGDK